MTSMIRIAGNAKLMADLITYFGTDNVEDVEACELYHKITENLKVGKYSFLPSILMEHLMGYCVETGADVEAHYIELGRMLGKARFFTYRVGDLNDLLDTYDVIKFYDVRTLVVNNVLKVYAIEGYEDDFRLCEMAMQMNYRQCGKVCPFCDMMEEDCCGHLTFSTRINRG